MSGSTQNPYYMYIHELGSKTLLWKPADFANEIMASFHLKKSLDILFHWTFRSLYTPKKKQIDAICPAGSPTTAGPTKGFRTRKQV